MKISRKLSNEIFTAITAAIESTMDRVDKKFRSGEITHDAWKEIYTSLCKSRSDAVTETLNRIASYNSRR